MGARCPVRPPQVHSSKEQIMRVARVENLTIRQLYERITAGGFCLVGTPADVGRGRMIGTPYWPGPCMYARAHEPTHEG